MGAKADQMKGQVKEAAGVLTGDEGLEAEGKADRRVGEIKEKLGAAKDKAEDVVDKAEAKAEEVVDKVKDSLHGK